MTEVVEIVIRPMHEAETRFVQATWARRIVRLPSMPRYNRPFVRIGNESRRVEVRDGRRVDVAGISIDASLLVRAHSMLVDELLERSSVAVATLPDVDEPIGWVAWEGPTVHFIHVIRSARRCRVAQRLLEHTGCSAASHLTAEAAGLLRFLRDAP